MHRGRIAKASQNDDVQFCYPGHVYKIEVLKKTIWAFLHAARHSPSLSKSQTSCRLCKNPRMCRRGRHLQVYMYEPLAKNFLFAWWVPSWSQSSEWRGRKGAATMSTTAWLMGTWALAEGKGMISAWCAHIVPNSRCGLFVIQRLRTRRASGCCVHPQCFLCSDQLAAGMPLIFLSADLAVLYLGAIWHSLSIPSLYASLCFLWVFDTWSTWPK